MPIPIIATGSCYDAYLKAARTNLENLHRLATGLRDAEAATEAQRLLDCFDSEAIDLNAMIDEANENADAFEDLTQRERAQLSIYRSIAA